MDHKSKIAVFYSNRAEKGLLESVMKCIEKSRKLDLWAVDLNEVGELTRASPEKMEYYGLYYTGCYVLMEMEKPDLAICPFDRFEMIFPTLAAFYQRIPIAQIHAGDLSLEGAWDDVTRHAISLYATIHFCDGERSYRRVVNMLESLGRSTEHVYEVGSTAFDDVKIDTDACPKGEFDLVIYCSPTRRIDLIFSEMQQIFNMLDKFTVWVEPSGKDPGDEQITASLKDYHTRLSSPQPYIVYKTLPRPLFLGLMKKCKRVIGNSSSLFYEAPFFHRKEDIIHVGVRNKGREYVKPRKGGSKRIVKTLEKYCDENLRQREDT